MKVKSIKKHWIHTENQTVQTAHKWSNRTIADSRMRSPPPTLCASPINMLRRLRAAQRERGGALALAAGRGQRCCGGKSPRQGYGSMRSFLSAHEKTDWLPKTLQGEHVQTRFLNITTRKSRATAKHNKRGYEKRKICMGSKQLWLKTVLKPCCCPC